MAQSILVEDRSDGEEVEKGGAIRLVVQQGHMAGLLRSDGLAQLLNRSHLSIRPLHEGAVLAHGKGRLVSSQSLEAHVDADDGEARQARIAHDNSMGEVLDGRHCQAQPLLARRRKRLSQALQLHIKHSVHGWPVVCCQQLRSHLCVFRRVDEHWNYLQRKIAQKHVLKHGSVAQHDVCIGDGGTCAARLSIALVAVIGRHRRRHRLGRCDVALL
eukprot:scaffold24393_cov112-Isochrysis_galbana.AAC.12